MQVFFKQYGERRTGTNYLRYLLTANFRNAVVLMHVLGDKHSPPAPFDAIWQASRDAADPALDFVVRATHAVPAESTRPDDDAQREELLRLAQPVACAYAGGSLRFVISIKNPYAWALSFARYSGWDGRRRVRRFGAPLADACAAFNRRYAAWRAFADERPAHVQFVRYEDLLTDVEQVLGTLETKFGLHRKAPQTVDAAGTLPAADWDHDDHLPSGARFPRREFYLRGDYLRELPADDRDLVTRSIDWSLMAPFAYEPVS